MIKQWERNTKKRFYLIIALSLVLVLSGGMYAYTYTTAVRTISIAEATADVVTVNATPSQPDWDSVTDNLSENTTCGDVPAGDLFEITPNAAYTGDLQIGVYLTNAADLIKAYQYLNMEVYVEGSESANETPNYRLLSLQNGQTNFSLTSMAGTSGTWTQTSQADFEGGTLNQVDTTTSPGDVILDNFGDNVNDSYDDETKIEASVNVTVSGGQAKLSGATGATDNETFRPNAAGDKTDIEEQYPVTGEHWDKVDEATSDGDGTYVETNNPDWEQDLYNIPDHTAGSGVINYVRVYIVASSQQAATQQNAYTYIKTNGSEYSGVWVMTTTSYNTYSHQWTNNPSTNTTWTWGEIDALQIGVGLRMAKANRWTRCTQVYAEVNYTTVAYNTRGTITSVNLLSGETVKSIDDFEYNAPAIPSGTSLKVQFSSDNTSWYNSAGTLDGWDTLSQGTANISLSGLGWSGANFYYHMEFTSDGVDTPVLDEIKVYFSTYYASGDLTSSTHDGGDYDDWDWEHISFTINEPAGTDIKFQLRTAATEGGLGSATWYGPTGAGDYYTTSGTAINAVHDGDRWIQYKAYFSGPGDSTPTLSDITISLIVEAGSYTVEIIGGSYCLVSDNTSEWGAGWTTTPEFYCEATQR